MNSDVLNQIIYFQFLHYFIPLITMKIEEITENFSCCDLLRILQNKPVFLFCFIYYYLVINLNMKLICKIAFPYDPPFMFSFCVHQMIGIFIKCHLQWHSPNCFLPKFCISVFINGKEKGNCIKRFTINLTSVLNWLTRFSYMTFSYPWMYKLMFFWNPVFTITV